MVPRRFPSRLDAPTAESRSSSSVTGLLGLVPVPLSVYDGVQFSRFGAIVHHDHRPEEPQGSERPHAGQRKERIRMSNLLRQVALVPDDNIAGQLTPSAVSRVAAALQKQTTRDFGPIWGVTATVDAFMRLEDVPLGYWPIIVGQEGQGGGGVHLDQDNQPYALVDLTSDWTVTASHECLETLADPFGNRLVAGDSPDPARPGRVEFLVEVCDPCEVPTLGYTANGVRVSDFYTPHYFDPSQPPGSPAAARYDFRGHITAPRQVLRGGYLSWREASGEWFQETFFSGTKPTFRSIGRFDNSAGSLRAWVDSITSGERLKVLKEREEFPQQVLVQLPGEHEDENNLAGQASMERAERWRAAIARVRKDGK
jgi:hypothetical protein